MRNGQHRRANPEGSKLLTLQVSSPCPLTPHGAVNCSQSQKTATAHLKSEQLLPFGLARRSTLQRSALIGGGADDAMLTQSDGRSGKPTHYGLLYRRLHTCMCQWWGDIVRNWHELSDGCLNHIHMGAASFTLGEGESE